MPPRAGEWAPGGAQNPPQIGPENLLRPAAAPSPQTPTAQLLSAPEPLLVPGLLARVAALSSPLSGSASLVSFSDTRPQPFFPSRLPVGPSPPFDSRSTEMLNPYRVAGLVKGLWEIYQHPTLFLQIFIDGFLGAWCPVLGAVVGEGAYLAPTLKVWEDTT